MNEFNKSVIILLLWILILSVCSAQDLPTNNLRTLTSTKEHSPIIATEGSVDVNEYFVGPGDNIFLSISGVRVLAYNLIIDQEGWIYLPQVGGIDLNNLTLAQAKNKLVETINLYYKDVQIFISLVDFRIIKVSLLGDVKKPSSFIITANSRLMDLISLSDELTETSNIRNIKIISKKNSTKIYDLLSFERFGNYAQNPLLREGDVVIVDRVDKTVTIHGLVKYPDEYAYVKSESVYNLIQLAGGFL
ncbi:MAG: polysaccharide biosynthesis/export family protein, partial [Ignavibacteria bacterium]|nr:polysaccharide biosynthesis/export family protein [Ignavibacteria bacterium]